MTTDKKAKYYVYVLLDPRKFLENTFEIFVKAIFYVGKGKHLRDLGHFRQTLKKLCNNCFRSAKTTTIANIWTSGYPVDSLRIISKGKEYEAYCKKTSVIAALKRDNLTNEINGIFYGTTKTWNLENKQLFGCYILDYGYKIYLINGVKKNTYF